MAEKQRSFVSQAGGGACLHAICDWCAGEDTRASITNYAEMPGIHSAVRESP
jgi:hypothetical protein